MIAAPSAILKAIRLYYGGSASSPVPSRAAAAVAPVPVPVPIAAAAAASSPQAAMPATQTVRSRGEPLSPQIATPVAAGVATPAVIVASGAAAPAVDEVKGDGAVVPREQNSAAPVPDSAPRTEEDAPVLEVREIEVPRNARKRAQIKLTLLDGTTIKVPSGRRRRAGDAAPESSGAPSGEAELTAADLVAALRAAAHGADTAEVLGSNLRWEKMMAAVLSLLLRKHLILERELIEELKKI